MRDGDELWRMNVCTALHWYALQLYGCAVARRIVTEGRLT